MTWSALDIWAIPVALGAYLVGSIPTGMFLARRRGIDLRTIGSGNIGATNVGRALGKKWAAVVLVTDACKGIVPVLIARVIGFSAWAIAAIALCTVLGHVFSLFLRGRGGKGVATALGAAMAISPPSALAAFAVYFAVYLPSRISSLGSMAGAVAYCVFLSFFTDAHPAYLAYAGIATAIIIARHRSNIHRLVDGKELKL